MGIIPLCLLVQHHYTVALPKLNCHAGLGPRNYLVLQADDPIYIIEYLLGLLIFLSFPVRSPVLCPEAEEGRAALCTPGTPELHRGLAAVTPSGFLLCAWKAPSHCGWKAGQLAPACPGLEQRTAPNPHWENVL